MYNFRNKLSKISQRWARRAPAPLNLRFGDLKLRDLAKLWISNWLWQNQTLKISY